MSIFLILAIIAALVRLLCWVLSKVPGKGAERNVESVTLRDGSYNWTGKVPPPVAIAQGPAATIPNAEGATAHCTNCGAETGVGWKFCWECGEALN